MNKGAVFSPCRKYRYTLWRIWEDKKPYVMFIGLNPSIADDSIDDPTIRKCINYCKSWGFGGLYMLNLFSYISTNPDKIKDVQDPIGKENDSWLLKISKNSSIVIAAWGNHGDLNQRSDDVLSLIANMHCLKVNKTGHPAHPLYQKSNLQPSLLKHNY
tara:strand:- start:25 stop:498 length:474 start_codon:yes stop_codon:yes gene_type:complete